MFLLWLKVKAKFNKTSSDNVVEKQA